MASATEMEKLQSTLDYFRRYYEFGEAIAVYQENRRYLGTYIHNRSDIEEQFGLKSQLKKAMLMSIGAGIMCGIIAMLIAGLSSFGLKNIIAFAVTAAVVYFGVNMFLKNSINKKFLIKWEEQKDVNVGLSTQVDDLEKRCQAIEKQQGDYLKALEEKKLVCIPVKYINEAEAIADYVRNDKAQTVEEAVKMYEDMLAAKKAEEERAKKAAEEEKAKRAAALKVSSAQTGQHRQGNPFLKLGAAKAADKSAEMKHEKNTETKSSPKASISMGSTNSNKKSLSSSGSAGQKQSIENEISLELQRVLGTSVSSASGTSSRSPRKPTAGLSLSSFTARKQAEELAAQKAAAISEDPVVKAVMAEPIVEEVAEPVVEEVAEPVVEEVAEPVVEEVAEPIVEEVAEPVVEEVAEPVVEEVAEPAAQEFSASATEEKPATKSSFNGLAMKSFNPNKSHTEEEQKSNEQNRSSTASSSGFLRMYQKSDN